MSPDYLKPGGPFGGEAAKVAFEHRVMLSDLLSASRTPYIVRARDALIRVLKAHGLSSKEIGKLVGRNHTSILSSLERTKGATP
jgi:chromosomal replication initiation ATPase DnaA